MADLGESITSMKECFEDFFATPFDLYKSQVTKNETDLQLKKLTTSHFMEESTHKAQIEIEQEPAASREQLQSLIQREATKQNKKLTEELKKLKSQLGNHSKKEKRGKKKSMSASVRT